VTRSWMPDPGWTGTWSLPELLTRSFTEAQRGALVALASAGMGPKRLVEAFMGAERIDDVVGDFVRDGPRALVALAKVGARAVVPSDEEYPDDLATIHGAPPLVFVRGERLDRLRPVVAIVGARACTSGAARFASRLGEAFASAGLAVVSGLARGIDIAAHRGALDGGSTIAVLGTGLDVCYPPEHREHTERIIASGALVTEFPLGVGPRAWHFPARNRIIAGLCNALIVVEAGLGSGALITAGFAADEGREVFACTTGPENPAGAGVRALLLDGARLIVDEEQAVTDVIGLLRDQEFDLSSVRAPAMTEVDLDGDLRTVYDAVTDAATTDEVAATAAMPTGRVATTLIELEIEGLVRNSHGRWSRVTRRP
jgi:DNA processing protein